MPIRMEEIGYVVEDLAVKALEVLRASPDLYAKVAEEMGYEVADLELVAAFLNDVRAQDEAGEDCTCPVCSGEMADEEAMREFDEKYGKVTLH